MYECITYMCMYVLIFCRELEDLKNLKVAEFDSLKKNCFFSLFEQKTLKMTNIWGFFIISQKTVFHFCKKYLKWKMWDLSLQGKSYVWKDSCFRDIVKNPLDESNYKILLKTLSWVIYVLFWLFAPI